MRTIRISEFRKRCLSLLGQLGLEGLVITRHGKPPAKLVAFERGRADLIGSLKRKLKGTGGVLTTGARWNARR